jgi:hypothetical protein
MSQFGFEFHIGSPQSKQTLVLCVLRYTGVDIYTYSTFRESYTYSNLILFRCVYNVQYIFEPYIYKGVYT